MPWSDEEESDKHAGLVNKAPQAIGNFGDTHLNRMDRNSEGGSSGFFGTVSTLLRGCMCRILSVGPIPDHIAFIMDGNRRYAKKKNLEEGAGHQAGFSALIALLSYCYELGVKYVTVYAFSIDNFRRRPDEVKMVMDLMQEKIEGLLNEDSIVNLYGVRVIFIGNLKLLHEPVRVAAEKAMEATAKNNKATLSICVAYSSTDEIVHAIELACQEKKRNTLCEVKLVDIERNLYMSIVPDPDILVRSSGETRLSNFLLWQTTNCLLYSPSALWPEIGFWHLVWFILNFQRGCTYL